MTSEMKEPRHVRGSPSLSATTGVLGNWALGQSFAQSFIVPVSRLSRL